MIRLGTCGGLGHEPGTIAVTNGTVDGCLNPGFTFTSCGELHQISTSANAELNEQLKQILVEKRLPHAFGNTMTTDWHLI